MAQIRLLTTIVGDGPVTGETGEVINVSEDIAKTWADGERAERVNAPKGEQNVAPPAGEKATAPPAGEKNVRPPRGERNTRRG